MTAASGDSDTHTNTSIQYMKVKLLGVLSRSSLGTRTHRVQNFVIHMYLLEALGCHAALDAQIRVSLCILV